LERPELFAKGMKKRSGMHFIIEYEYDLQFD